MSRPRVMLGAVALCLAASSITACTSSGASPTGARASAQTPRDELPAAMDNGAKGRNTFHSATHVRPAKACADQLHASRRSLVIRVLPDGPRTPEGKLAFTSGVCVYLPPGYVGSRTRYPVVYLLHGGGGDAGDAVAQGRLRQTMDGLIADDPSSAAIVVMPDGDDAQWYDGIDGQIRNETYVAGDLVPYFDRHFRTIPTRAGRAITGVSNGGYGAMLLAAKHPDLFAAAGGMSSNLDWLGARGLGDPNGPYYRANHPIELADRLANTDIVLDISSRCTSTNPADLCATQGLDQFFLASNRAFALKLMLVPGRRAVTDYREDDGAHQWRTWAELLRNRQLPFLLAHLTDPRR
ncbi:MAG: alpha/beta hydrolase [Acidimicrobiia bacterium]